MADVSSSSPTQYQRPNYTRPHYARAQQGSTPIQPSPARPFGLRSGALVSKEALENESGNIFSSMTTLMGFGTRDYAFGAIPRGYGFTLVSIAGCYALLRWERSRIEKSKKMPPFMTTNNWFSRLKTAEKEYALARMDFPRTTMLMLIGGLGLPYASAMGGIFWIVGRATDFHEMEKRAPNDHTEPVFCRFGKFLMICGICKCFFDIARGRLTSTT